MDQPSSTESNALTLRIKFKSASLDEFISRYGVDVSPGGIFIRTKQPVEVGTTLQFEFSLADGSALLAGLGTVAWVRENDPARANSVPGMGLRFDKLTPDSQRAHQTILAEKARKEGKPQGTPYPPTSFVAPASRPSPIPEPAKQVEPPVQADGAAKPEAPLSNFSKTLPAPASLVAKAVEQSIGDSGEFDSGGKTEISDKPIEYYMQEAEAAAKAASVQSDIFAPKSQLEGWKTDAHPEGETEAPPAPEEVALIDSQSYTSEASAEIAAPTDLTASGERRNTGKQAFASLLDLGDTAEAARATEDKLAVPTEVQADSSSGVPIAVATSEKTEEVSLVPDKVDDVMEPVDLGTSSPEEEVESVPPLSEAERGVPVRKRSTGLLVGAVLFAGAAAFAAVYLIQTKPWQGPAKSGEPMVVVKKGPAVAVLPAPAAAPAPSPAAKPAPAALPAAAPGEERTKPSAVEEPAAKKAAAKGEEKPASPVAAEKAVAEKAAAEKAAAEKVAAEKAAAEKPAAEKPAARKPAADKPEKPEKPLLAKAETETPAAKSATKGAAKASAKSSAESASAEKSAGPSDEEVYRLSFRSTPSGAEVLIDGEYFMRTPCVKRILDPKKSMAITIRHEGYEPHERMIGSSDNWVKKGDERVLSVSVNLKKISKPAGAEGAAAPAGPEAKPEFKAAPDLPEPAKAKE